MNLVDTSAPAPSPADAAITRQGIEAVARRVDARISEAHAAHLGYPYNLVGRSGVPSYLAQYLINNLGGPPIQAPGRTTRDTTPKSSPCRRG
jgi:hypothetical protein